MKKTYAQRCAELEAEERKKSPYDQWGPGAFMPPVFAEPETSAERIALALVKSRFGNAISVRVENVVDLVADALSVKS